MSTRYVDVIALFVGRETAASTKHVQVDIGHCRVNALQMQSGAQRYGPHAEQKRHLSVKKGGCHGVTDPVQPVVEGDDKQLILQGISGGLGA